MSRCPSKAIGPLFSNFAPYSWVDEPERPLEVRGRKRAVLQEFVFEAVEQLPFISPAAVRFVHFVDVPRIQRFIRAETDQQVDARVCGQLPEKGDLVIEAGGCDNHDLVSELGASQFPFPSYGLLRTLEIRQVAKRVSCSQTRVAAKRERNLSPRPSRRSRGVKQFCAAPAFWEGRVRSGDSFANVFRGRAGWDLT